MKFNHIGIACDDINKKLEFIKSVYEILNISEIIYDPEQNVELCFVETSDNIVLELVAGETVKTFCKKNQPFYHICYEVENLEDQLSKLIFNNCLQISVAKPAIAFNNRKVVFVHTPIGLIELLEEKK